MDGGIGPGEWAQAIALTDGTQIVLAGPGAGKTEFLARRAAHLIRAGKARPDEICVLTFSRRAAAELRGRIEDRLARSMLQISASTFHSFSYRLLEYVGPSGLGWSRLPTILTGPEQIAFVGALLSRETASDWPPAFRDLLLSSTMAEEVAEFILRANESLLVGAALRAVAEARADWRPLPSFMERYAGALRQEHRIDYGTLQATAVRLLDHEKIRQDIAARYRYVLVDEYQDTTRAQARLCEQLSASGGNLTVAADPNQSIYGFRGARPENVEEFTRQNDAQRVILAESFRVPEAILGAANRLIAAAGSAPSLRPAPHEGAVHVYLFDQHSHEAEWIAAELQRLHLAEGVPLGRTAVLVRSKRRLLTELSRALARRGVPHDEPQSRLADTAAVRMVLDCVEACEFEALATRDEAQDRLRNGADAAMARVLLGPLFETPLGMLRSLQEMRGRTGAPWSEVLASLPEGDGLAELMAKDEWIRVPADQGFWTWWTRLPQLTSFVTRRDTTEHRAAWSSLGQVLDRVVERDPSTSLIDYARMSADEDFEATPLLSFRKPADDRVVLATLHQAKGLEFDVVFVADAVEGVFPDLRRERSLLQSHLLSAEEGSSGAEAMMSRLAEELRLAYVGMTRARKRVTWTATVAGIDHAQTQPSRFLPLVAGVESLEQLPGAPATDLQPVTARAAEAFLRRILVDPVEAPARRLGAAGVLTSSSQLRSPLHFAGVRPTGSDKGLNPADLRLSPSQAGIYERCPRRYALSRRLRLSDDETVYARFGSLIHEVLEATERAAMARGDNHGSLEEATIELDRRLPEYEFGPPGPTEAWRERGVECLSRLYARWPNPDATPIALEHKLQLELEGTEWLGYADRIEELPNGTRRIVDYKTSKRAAPVSELSLQLGFYLLAAAGDDEPGPPLEEAEAWYPLAGDKLTVRQLPPGELGQVQERLVQIADGIRSENWQPRPHEGCERCPVRILCPEWPEGQEAFAR